jgi:hypothetical protein
MRPTRLKRPSTAGKANEADGAIAVNGARLMRPMRLKRPSPANEANDSRIVGLAITATS